MGKTKDSLGQLEQALEVSGKDVRDATLGVMKDLRRFQGEKEGDLGRYMVSGHYPSQQDDAFCMTSVLVKG